MTEIKSIMQPGGKFTCTQMIYIVALLKAHRLPSGLCEQASELDVVVAACLLAGARRALHTGSRWDTG